MFAHVAPIARRVIARKRLLVVPLLAVALLLGPCFLRRDAPLVDPTDADTASVDGGRDVVEAAPASAPQGTHATLSSTSPVSVPSRERAARSSVTAPVAAEAMEGADPAAPAATAPATASAAPAPASPAPMTAASSAGSAAYEEGIFELVVERVPARVVLIAFVDARGKVLIPVRSVVEHAGIPSHLVDGRLVLEWPRDVWRTEVDPAAGTVRVGDGEVRELDVDSRLVRGGELYLSSAALGALLGAQVVVSWSDLLIHVRGVDFPATERLRRDAARERAARIQAGFGRDPHESVPFIGRTGGASASWGLTMSASGDGATHGSGRLAVGGSVAGGATEVGLTGAFGSPGQEGVSDVFGRFSRPVFGTPWLRRVELGSVVSGGPLARRMVGATLTNEPYNQPRYFGDAAILPAVPTGWEYEVYQGESLVGVSGGEAREEIEAPLNYGSTPLTVRLLGPAGQEIVEDLLYVVSPRQVPAGAWRYDVGAGACQGDACRGYGYGELRYGARSWLTLGAGADLIDAGPGAGDDPAAFGSLVVRPRRNLSADLQVRPGSFLQTGARLLTSSSGSLAASYTWNRPRGDTQTLQGWQGQLTGSGRLPLPGGARSVTGHLYLRGREAQQVDSWRAGVGLPLGRSYVMADYEAGLQARDLVTVRGHTPLSRNETWLRDLAVNAALSTTLGRVELVEAGVSFRPSSWGSMQAGVRFRHGERARFTVGFVSRTPVAFTQTRAVAGARSSITMSAEGGAVMGSGPDLPILTPLRGTGRAGVSGQVFHDLNGNGVRDPGETTAEGITVTVAGRRESTDGAGRFRVWDVQPFDPVLVTVDSLSLAFNWMPASRQSVVRPSPNVFNTVDLPLVRTREVVGRVEGPEGRGLGGVTVEIVDAAGETLLAGRTFSDGEIYLQRVPPGAYTLRVADSSLAALGWFGRAVDLHVPFEGDDVLEAPTLTMGARCGCPDGPASPGGAGS